VIRFSPDFYDYKYIRQFARLEVYKNKKALLAAYQVDLILACY